MPATHSEITVTADPADPRRGRLSVDPLEVACALGRGGVTGAKREGDGATPLGTWPLRYGLYRPDRHQAPVSTLAFRAIGAQDGWCDAPGDARYNQPVALPYPASAETLWRDDGLYDFLVVLGYNDDPPVAGRGSAIFFHLARPGYDPTEGCVAVSADDMLKVLELCGPGTVMRIESGG